MAEALPAFVNRRRPEWERLRGLVARTRRGGLSLSELNELDGLYRRAASDLAAAQTFYRNTEAHRYLNRLCADAYAAIYEPPRHRPAQVRAFFRSGFPRTVRREWRFLLASASLLLFGIALGALVVIFDPHGVRLLIPPQVRAAVESHQMWTDSILSAAPPSLLASKIATNNLSVVILAFASGIALGVGTILVLVSNGVSLGAISAYCVRERLGGALFAFIPAHGFVELSVIVLAGAAGLILGHALVDPGELPRGQALKRRALEAVKLVLGGAPFLAGIGIVEGFVSPGHLFAVWVRLALGLTLGILFWSYLLLAGRGAQPGDEPER